MLRLSLPTPSPGALSLLQRYPAIALQGEGRGNCRGGQQADKLLNEKAKETLEQTLCEAGPQRQPGIPELRLAAVCTATEKVGFMQCFLSISTFNSAALQARFLPNRRPWLTREYHKSRKKARRAIVSSKAFLVSTWRSSGGYLQPLNRRAADTAQAVKEDSSSCQVMLLHTYRCFYPHLPEHFTGDSRALLSLPYLRGS